MPRECSWPRCRSTLMRRSSSSPNYPSTPTANSATSPSGSSTCAARRTEARAHVVSALGRVKSEEKRAARKVEAGQAMLNEAATIRRKALSEARAAGVPVAELAELLGVTVQRVYQMLSDDKG